MIHDTNDIRLASSDRQSSIVALCAYTTSGGDYGHIPVRWESSDDYLSVLVTPTSLELRSAVSGTVTTLDTATVSTTANQNN